MEDIYPFFVEFEELFVEVGAMRTQLGEKISELGSCLANFTYRKNNP